jgi:hypothetical protein
MSIGVINVLFAVVVHATPPATITSGHQQLTTTAPTPSPVTPLSAPRDLQLMAPGTARIVEVQTAR